MTYPFGRNLLLSTVGFERLIDAFEKFDGAEGATKAQAYPPYNIVKQAENQYRIEIAVAGFKSHELDITSEANRLTVIGKVSANAPGEYLHKGIATRDFTHHFTLAETVVVRGADVRDGLLVIQLENVIPDEKLPRKIKIGGALGSVEINREALPA
jgi:molecular chaperone IbpA